MPIQVLFEVMFRFAFVVVLGYALRKKGIITDEFQRILSELLLTVALPLSVIAAGNSSYDSSVADELLIAAAIAVGYYLITIPLMVLLSRTLPMNRTKQNTTSMLVILSNLAYFGFPIIFELFGAEGMLYAITYSLTFQLAAYTYCVWLLGGEKASLKIFLKPMTIAPFIAIGIFISPFRLPDMVVSSFEMVGDMSSTFALLIIGSSLAKIKFLSVWTDKWAWLVSFFRLLLIPAVVIGVLWALGLKGVMPATMAILSSLSPATINVIFAERFGHDVSYATRAVVQGTVLLLVMLPLLVITVQHIF